MQITKFGHSCLLVEESGAKFLFDPGIYSTLPELNNLDAIFITHEHGDHFDVPSIKKLLANNPGITIYTNKGVGDKLQKEGVTFELYVSGTKEVKGVGVKAVGEKHAFIYKTLPICDNTGYVVAGKFLHPGDALDVKDEKVEILACPVVAPWMKMADMLDYGLEVLPKVAFPIHDGFVTEKNPYYGHAEREFGKAGIKWFVPEIGKSFEV